MASKLRHGSTELLGPQELRYISVLRLLISLSRRDVDGDDGVDGVDGGSLQKFIWNQPFNATCGFKNWPQENHQQALVMADSPSDFRGFMNFYFGLGLMNHLRVGFVIAGGFPLFQPGFPVLLEPVELVT